MPCMIEETWYEDGNSFRYIIWFILECCDRVHPKNACPWLSTYYSYLFSILKIHFPDNFIGAHMTVLAAMKQPGNSFVVLITDILANSTCRKYNDFLSHNYAILWWITATSAFTITWWLSVAYSQIYIRLKMHWKTGGLHQAACNYVYTRFSTCYSYSFDVLRIYFPDNFIGTHMIVLRLWSKPGEYV